MDDLHALSQQLPASQRTPLAHRIHKDVEDNAIGFSLVLGVDEQL